MSTSACPTTDGSCSGPPPSSSSITPSSSSSGGSNPPTPILNIQPIAGLSVATHGRALHISAPKDAIVTLYDLSGTKLSSNKVLAGNRVLNFANQSPGVYYAIVQIGSSAQKFNIVLK